ncbi:hypothetical protein DFH07DRAFT_775085 [Mycena maculata]|uniref:Uncharacterized protein n=1 Tax=Mycena maculata TaxID=230809 RepID=A0AAD7ITX6_9AGAR|nr:hypothetical protein DFH07DRAFT_775085 [Mycena maculata]
MPWHQGSDEDPDGSILHFVLGLNERLQFLAKAGVVASYAFSGKTALLLIALSVQGRDGKYHDYTPRSAEFASQMGYPVQRPTPTAPKPRMRMGNGSQLTCDLQLKEPNESGCETFEAGLAHIRSALTAAEDGYWFHTSEPNMYGRMCPVQSTYVFQHPLGMKHVFQVLWNTAIYPPPQRPVQFTYPSNLYFDWPITTPLNIEHLFGKSASPDPEAIAFIQNVLDDNTGKGKGRA